MTEDGTDTNLLLCPPTSSPPSVSAVARSCTDCGQPVWVSCVMQTAVDTGEVRPWCNACALGSGEQLVFKQHPDQATDGMNVAAFDQMAAGIRNHLARVDEAHRTAPP